MKGKEMSSSNQDHPLIEPFLDTGRLFIARVDIRFNSVYLGETPRQIYFAFEKNRGCCRPAITVTVSEDLGAWMKEGPLIEYIETIEECRKMGYAKEAWTAIQSLYDKRMAGCPTTFEGRALMKSLGYDLKNEAGAVDCDYRTLGESPEACFISKGKGIIVSYEERIEEIKERCDAATKGPWWTGSHNSTRWLEFGPSPTDSGMAVSGGNMDNDGDFIAHAREDIPWLLKQLEAANRNSVLPTDGGKVNLWVFKMDMRCRWVDSNGEELLGGAGSWEKAEVHIAAAADAEESDIFKAAREAAIRLKTAHLEEESEDGWQYTPEDIEFIYTSVKSTLTVDDIVGCDVRKGD